MGDAYSAVPGSPDPPWFNGILEVIEQFELASIGLAAWELFLGEEELVPAWRQAMSTGVIERVGRCPYTREPMYRLTGEIRAADIRPAEIRPAEIRPADMPPAADGVRARAAGSATSVGTG